jgi:hypothetical protein
MRTTKGSTASAVPATIQNSPRQSITCSSKAPSTGPAAGTMASTIETAAMPRTVSSSFNVARTTLGAITVAAPAATPCSSRITSSVSMPGASAQAALASTGASTPHCRQRRGPSRFSAWPHSNCDAASPARNKATVACACVTPMASSACSTGTAGR